MATAIQTPAISINWEKVNKLVPVPTATRAKAEEKVIELAGVIRHDGMFYGRLYTELRGIVFPNLTSKSNSKNKDAQAWVALLKEIKFFSVRTAQRYIRGWEEAKSESVTGKNTEKVHDFLRDNGFTINSRDGEPYGGLSVAVTKLAHGKLNVAKSKTLIPFPKALTDDPTTVVKAIRAYVTDNRPKTKKKSLKARVNDLLAKMVEAGDADGLKAVSEKAKISIEAAQKVAMAIKLKAGYEKEAKATKPNGSVKKAA